MSIEVGGSDLDLTRLVLALVLILVAVWVSFAIPRRMRIKNTVALWTLSMTLVGAFVSLKAPSVDSFLQMTLIGAISGVILGAFVWVMEHSRRFGNDQPRQEESRSAGGLAKTGLFVGMAAGLCVLAVIGFLAWPRRSKEDEDFMKRPGRERAPSKQVDSHSVPPASRSQVVSGDYETVSDVNLLPDVVRDSYGIGSHKPLSGMANPGQSFNATDLILNNKLPRKRLVFAAVRRVDNFWIVHFEYGGIAHGYEVHFLSTSTNTTTPVWRCNLQEAAKDLQTLKDKVVTGACK